METMETDETVVAFDKEVMAERLEKQASGHVHNFEKVGDKYVVFGELKSWGEFECNSAIVLNEDLTLDEKNSLRMAEIFSSFNDEVNGIIGFGNTLIVYGDFTKFRHIDCQYVAWFYYLNKSFFFESAFTKQFKDSGGPNGGIEKIFSYGNSLFACGDFNKWKDLYNYQVSIAVVNHNFRLEPWKTDKFKEVEAMVYGILSYKKNLLLAYGEIEDWGEFENLDNLVVLNSDFSLNWEETKKITFAADEEICGMIPWQAGFIAVGGFTYWGLHDCNFITRLNADMQIDEQSQDGAHYPCNVACGIIEIAGHPVIFGTFKYWKKFGSSFIAQGRGKECDFIKVL